MHLGFTGTRDGLSFAQRRALEKLIVRSDLSFTHSGDCIGADAEFYFMVGRLKPAAYRYGHPPDKRKFRAFLKYDYQLSVRGYLERNRDIVDASQLLIACPKTRFEQRRSGTWYTIRYARSKCVDSIIVYPDGSREIDETRPLTKKEWDVLL